MNGLFCPQFLHRPYQVLFFEMDDLILIILLFSLALIFGGIFWVLFFVVPYVMSIFKKRFPRGYVKHMIYFLGLFAFKFAPSVFENRLRA